MFIFCIHIPQTQFSDTEGIFITSICVAAALPGLVFLSSWYHFCVYNGSHFVRLYIYMSVYLYVETLSYMRYSQEECIKK